MSAQLLVHLGRAGWFKLTQPYPDRGPLHGVDWYNTLLHVGAGGAE
jgi:hypothetical protein